MVMATQYGFIAFCSAVLNSPTNKKKFLDRNKQKELFEKYNLTRSQIKAASSMNIEAITEELRKEITAASKASDPSKVAMLW